MSISRYVVVAVVRSSRACSSWSVFRKSLPRWKWHWATSGRMPSSPAKAKAFWVVGFRSLDNKRIATEAAWSKPAATPALVGAWARRHPSARSLTASLTASPRPSRMDAGPARSRSARSPLPTPNRPFGVRCRVRGAAGPGGPSPPRNRSCAPASVSRMGLVSRKRRRLGRCAMHARRAWQWR